MNDMTSYCAGCEQHEREIERLRARVDQKAEMIDAAWLAARGSESSLSILRLLHVNQCFGCNGWGRTLDEDGEEVIAECLVCNGHGWTIKEPAQCGST